MVALRFDRALLLVLLACFLVVVSPRVSLAQAERTPAPVNQLADVDVEFQLHLLIASNAAESGKLPATLESIARELRPVVPFSNYRLGATFLSRVKNGRLISVKGVGRTLLVTPALEASVLPTFYEFTVATFDLKSDNTGRTIAQLTGFRFGLRIPLQTGLGQTKDSGDSKSTILYESAGISTDITVPEGKPVVVGTLDVGRPNETLVLVLIANRASVR